MNHDAQRAIEREIREDAAAIASADETGAVRAPVAS